MTMSRQVKDQGPVCLDEEEAKNEQVHVLLADESEDVVVQPDISTLSTDHIQTSICTNENCKDIENDKSTKEIEQMVIPKDSFSMLYAGKTRADYILPILVFILQVAILVLILSNMLKDSQVRPLSNAMNIPVAVPWTVTASQYIACLVAVISADDLIQGMLFMCKRIIPSGYSLVGGELPPISRKWEISNIMRFMEGLLVIVVSFVFIVQSSTVIDLFLNFAGVTFVGLLDDICFLLAENGLLGRRAKYTAKSVSNFEVYKKTKGDLDKKMKLIRIVVFVVITVTLWAGLSFFVWKQTSLDYACQSLTVSVGESAYPFARHFSGYYALPDKNKTFNHRAKYVEKGGLDGGASIVYSEKVKRWIFVWDIGHLDFELVSFDLSCLCFEFECDFSVSIFFRVDE